VRHLGFRTTQTVTALPANITISQPVLQSPTVTGNVLIASDGDTTLTIQSITGSGQSPSIRLQRGTYGTDAFSDIRVYNTLGTFHVDNIDSSENATNCLIASSGGIALQGATAATSGVGIKFPATQSASSDANTLDDYEEGTFTPFFVPDGGAFTTLTYSAQTGKYTKIGNFVFFSINIFTSVVTLGTASGGLAIGGLPFTSDATTQLAPGVALGRVYRWANAIPNIRCNIDTNSTLIRLPNMATNSTSATNAQVTDLTTGSNSFYNCVDIGGCYKIV
jgi:hypothetical protein